MAGVANLHTKDGQFVHKVETPDFLQAPEIIQWGSRYFYLHDKEKLEYREGMLYVDPGLDAIGETE